MTADQGLLITNLITVEWTGDMTTSEVQACFNDLTRLLASCPEQLVHVLFDVRDARQVPATVPMLATRTGFITRHNLGTITFAANAHNAITFAEIASRISSKDIRIFRDIEAAAEYTFTNAQASSKAFAQA